MDFEEKNQHLKLAEHYFRDNNYSFAQHILDKIIKIDSSNSKANELLSYIYENLGKLDLSFELLKVACSQSDCSPEALYNLGSIQLERCLFLQAIESFKKSMSKGGETFEALHDLATAKAHIGDLNSALNCYQKCLNFGRSSHELFFNIARIYDDLKRFDEAITYYNKALSLNPAYAEAWSNKGCTLTDLKRFDEAITHYDKALSLNPAYAEAWSNKGYSLTDLKRFDVAITHFEKALSLNPNIKWVYGDVLFTKMKICSWENIKDDVEKLTEKLHFHKKVSVPFPLLSLIDDPAILKEYTQEYAQDKYPSNAYLGNISRREKKEKIRIGYFSADFKTHPVALLTAELFEIHDRDKFEIYAFSLGKAANGDQMRTRLKNSFDHFLDLEGKSDQGIAILARELNIDIAVDLSGFTQDSRTGIFSYRVAPIQINYLGYPGTLGVPYMDYIVADNTIIPASHQIHYIEKVVYLPHTYIVDDSKRVASKRKFTRQECGLPKNAFVFCSFNNSYKLNEEMIDSWSRILLGSERSVLWLSENNELSMTNLKSKFVCNGVDSSRIIFAKRIESMNDHLARYALADLFLDTIPYNAHTTSVDCLKAGVPVITCIGSSFAGRVGASLLNAINLPELITTSISEYEKLAITLATQPHQTADLKQKIAANMLTAPLFNTSLFAKHLEAAYIEMMRRYWEELPPEHIYIEP